MANVRCGLIVKNAAPSKWSRRTRRQISNHPSSSGLVRYHRLQQHVPSDSVPTSTAFLTTSNPAKNCLWSQYCALCHPTLHSPSSWRHTPHYPSCQLASIVSTATRTNVDDTPTFDVCRQFRHQLTTASIAGCSSSVFQFFVFQIVCIHLLRLSSSHALLPRRLIPSLTIPFHPH